MCVQPSQKLGNQRNYWISVAVQPPVQAVQSPVQPSQKLGNQRNYWISEAVQPVQSVQSILFT